MNYSIAEYLYFVKVASISNYSYFYDMILFFKIAGKPIFKNIHVARGCKLVFEEISKKYGYEILTLEILEDHVHLFLKLQPTHSLSKTFQLFKGISSRKLFWRFPSLKKQLWGGHLWSKGKFFRSVGEVTAERVEFYIRESQTGGKFSKNKQKSLK